MHTHILMSRALFLHTFIKKSHVTYMDESLSHICRGNVTHLHAIHDVTHKSVSYFPNMHVCVYTLSDALQVGAIRRHLLLNAHMCKCIYCNGHKFIFVHININIYIYTCNAGRCNLSSPLCKCTHVYVYIL